MLISPLLPFSGLDATAAFEDVGHSESAYEMLKDFYIGEVGEISSADATKEDSCCKPKEACKPSDACCKPCTSNW